MIDLEAARYLWHPIAASSDLVPRHVFHAQILGRELALWRADDDNVNAWENRCLHRGVRLSIGINDGTELLCQYHGWRYANRTAGCTYIPAHPADAPARTICNNTYPAMEQYGLVWSGESPEGPLPVLSTVDTSFFTPLRAVTVNATSQDLLLPLIQGYTTRLPASDDNRPRYGADTPDAFTIILRVADRSQTGSTPVADIAFFLQPVDAGRTTIRGILCGIDEHNTDAQTLNDLLRFHNRLLCTIRDRLESTLADAPSPAPWIPIIAAVSENQASLPAMSDTGNSTPLRIRVASIDSLSPTVRHFRFEPLDDLPESQLPTAQPGAHIDVQLPNGLVRQYSLINGPGETDHYAIAVKREAASRGGSQALHEQLRVGDLLASSVPRNNFTLRRDAEHTHLIAGGIGLTPLLAMARALHHMGRPYTLHHFAAQDTELLFQSELQAMSGEYLCHVGLTPSQTAATMAELLATPDAHQHLYLCGPAPMLQCARDTAAACQWPEHTVHFEYFSNPEARDDSSAFEVDLARSGLSLNVPAGQSLLSVLRENGVTLPSSCEQGACGTCRVTVLDGTPDHQDVYLSESEKARGDCLMSCVSRARSQKLTLDL